MPVCLVHGDEIESSLACGNCGHDRRGSRRDEDASSTRITQDLYQHARLQLQVDAAEKVVALLPGSGAAKETGS